MVNQKTINSSDMETFSQHMTFSGSSTVLNFTRFVCEPTSFCFHCCDVVVCKLIFMFLFVLCMFIEVVGIYLDSVSFSLVFFSHWTMLDIVHTFRRQRTDIDTKRDEHVFTIHDLYHRSLKTHHFHSHLSAIVACSLCIRTA